MRRFAAPEASEVGAYRSLQVRSARRSDSFATLDITGRLQDQNAIPAQIKIRDIYCDLIQGLSLNPPTVFPGFQRNSLSLTL